MSQQAIYPQAVANEDINRYLSYFNPIRYKMY